MASRRIGRSAAHNSMDSYHFAFVLLANLLFTNAFSTKKTNTNAAFLSRLQTAQAELQISVGRIPGTAMPPEWAASGAKLVFTLELEFTSDNCDYEMSNERLLRGDSTETLMSVEPLNAPSFISSNGQEVIRVLPGAYGCQVQWPQSRQYACRFYLDFPEGAKRNDVELPPERIYFLSSCWLADDETIGRAQEKRDEIVKSLQKIERDLEEIQQASSGFIQKALGFRQSVDLVERRGQLNLQLEELNSRFPLDPARVIHGPSNIIFEKEGRIAVKRFRGALGTREQYHWVGTFGFNRFMEDE